MKNEAKAASKKKKYTYVGVAFSSQEYIPVTRGGSTLRFYYFLGDSVVNLRKRMMGEVRMGYIDPDFLILTNSEDDKPETVYDVQGGRTYKDMYNLTEVYLPQRTFREWVGSTIATSKEPDMKLSTFISKAERVNANRI